VPVNARFQTKDPDIFAVGDIALVPDPVTGEARRVEHWVEAERQGQHAGLTMAGGAEDYSETPFFWTQQYDFSIKYGGYASSFDQLESRGDLEGEDVLVGFYQKGALRAVAAIGRAVEFIAASEIIKAGASVPAARFKDPGADLIDWIKR
jgi:NADPH-dependent 2,4-dienoyl-CoA reductase/sulfur reductase-like enzyme